MARTRISADKLFDTVEVDIEGNKFIVKPNTRSVEEGHLRLIRKAEEREEEIEQGTSDDDGINLEALFAAREEIVGFYGDLLDLRLEPMGETKTHAKTLIKKAYKDDQMGIASIRALVEGIAEASTQRPT